MKAYGLSFNGPEDFLDEQVLHGIERDWRAQIASFVADLPRFERCARTLRGLLEEVFS